MIKTLFRALGCATLLAVLGIWSQPANARAETLVYTATVTTMPVSWPVGTAVTFPQFDPTQGILTKVEMTATGSISGTVGYENDHPTNGASLGVDVIATLYFTQPNNLPPPLAVRLLLLRIPCNVMIIPLISAAHQE